MKVMFRSVLVVFAIFFCVSAQADSVLQQKLEWIGTNRAGNIVAYFLTHIGPDSGSPFVTLRISKVDRKSPLAEDLRFFMRPGTEEDFSELKEALLRDNARTLTRFGIEQNAQSIASAEVSDGRVSFNESAYPFLFQSKQVSSCHHSDLGFFTHLCFNSKCTDISFSDTCDIGKVELHSAFHTKASVWFVINRTHVQDFGEQHRQLSRWLNVYGFRAE